MDLNIEKGKQVAFNTLEDAIWYDVIEIEGFAVLVREVGTEYEPHYMDRCYVKQVR